MTPSTNSQRRALWRAMRAVVQAPDPDEGLRRLARRLVTDLGYRAAIVRLDEGPPGALRCVAAHGLGAAYLGKGPVDAARSGVDARVLAGETVAIEDVTTDAAFQYGASARVEGLRSMLALTV